MNLVLVHKRNMKGSNNLELCKNIWFQLLVIAILLLMGGVEMNPGPNLPEVHSQCDGYCYTKTTGCANMKGELYEIKLAALLFARELIKEKDFFLASNMAAAGAFDDVVLKLGHRTMFIQLKHRDNNKMEIGKQHLIATQGNFSLLRYHNSFCEIKQQWFKNKDFQHCGRFEDALFIVYTNARLKRDLGNEVGNNEWQGFLSSGGKCICFTEDLCPSDDEDSSNFKEFLSQLWFFTEQATQNQLDALIKKELRIFYGTDAVYAQFLSGVENWWRDSDIYLTKKVAFFQDIFQCLAANISKQKQEEIKAINISFNKNQYILIRTFLIYAQVLHIFPKGTDNCVILSSLKVYESLKKQYHLMIDVSTLHIHLSEVLALWMRWCDVLIIVGHIIINTDDIMDILQNYPSKRLVLIGEATVWNEIQCKKFTYYDNIVMRQLSKESQRSLLTALVKFQDYNVTFGAITENEAAIQNTLPADVIVSLLTKKLEFGDILTGDSHYYIPRTLRISGQERNLYSNVDSVLDVPHRVVLVSAEPGMGKSTLLTHLALGTKQTQPAMWVIRVNLNDFTQELNRLPENLQLNHVFDFLLGASGTPVEWKAMFLLKLESMKNVCILLDGYDEISPTHANKVSLMLKHIQKTEIQHLWVTTRPVMRNKLEQELSIKTLTLEPLSGEDQRNFLFKFWKRSIPHIEESFLNKFISDLLQLIEANLNDRDREFMGIPLQSLLMAEAFENDLRTFSTTNELKLPNRFNLLQLYISFVKRKLEIYYEKNGIDLTKPGISYDYIQTKEMFLQNHMISALIVLLPNHELQFKGKMRGTRKFKSLFNSFILSKYKIQDPMNIENSVKNFLIDIEEGREQTGIINQIVNDKPEFIHRTFAEYFAALWFSRNFESITDYLKEKLFDPNFLIVRNFFDRILAQNFDLHNAILNQNKDLVGSLLSEHPEYINVRDKGGRTALHLAVMNFTDKLDDTSSNIMHEIILVLFDYGADPTIKDNVFSWRPLRLADRIRAWIAIDLLLGEDPVKKDLVLTQRSVLEDAGNGTSLHIAAKHALLRLAMFLLENNSNVDAVDNKLRTPLIWAAKLGHLSVVECLIKHDATKEAYDIFSNTALLVAAQSGHFEVFKLLLQHNTNMMACNCDGNTVLHCSVKSGNLELARYIADRLKPYIDCCNNKNQTPLWLAAHSSFLHITEFLCEHDIDLNIQDSELGWTPLHVAASEGHLKIVDNLIQHGATINAHDEEGNTPLLLSAWRGHFEIFKLLAQQDSTTTYNKNGNTVLHCAAWSGNIKLVTYILDTLLVDVDCYNFKHRTPVWFSTLSGHSEITELLIKHGAKINILHNEMSWSPLHAAVSECDPQIVQNLVQLGTELNVSDKNGCTPLHIAARESRLQVVQYLIEHGATLNACDEEGNTPLLLSAWRGHFEIFKLLSQQDSMAIYNKNGNTVLHCAAWSGNIELVTYILDTLSVDVDCYNFKYQTPVWVSTLSGHSEITQLLIKRGAKINIQDSELGWSLLHVAASECDLQTVQNLVQLGTKLDISDKNGCTPLHIATRESCLQVVQYLIQHGATLNARDEEGNTPLLLSAWRGHFEIFKLLSQQDSMAIYNKNGNTVLHCAAWSGNIELVTYILDTFSVDVDCYNFKHRTPVWFSTQSGHSEITELLIKRGVKINIQDSELGWSPLHAAASECDLQIVQNLVQLGTKLDVSDKNGSKPLHIAAMEGRLKIVQYLIQQGCLVSDRDCRGNTPLLIAAYNGHLEVFKLLLENYKHVELYKNEERVGLCINYNGNTVLHYASSSGNVELTRYVLDTLKLEITGNYSNTICQTPLWCAAWSGHLQIMELLCDNGGDIHIQDTKWGYTPLHVATRQGYLHIVHYLIEQGARVSICDNEGNTAFLIAADCGEFEIFKYLSQLDNITVCNNYGKNALHCAAWSGNTELIRYILDSQTFAINCYTLEHQTPLWFAARSGQFEAVKMLCERGADIHVQDFVRHWSPLHVATYENHIQVVDYLIQQGSIVNAYDGKNNTALILSAWKGHFDVFKLLSEHDTNMTVSNKDGNNILHCAAWSGNIDLTKYILETFPLDVNCYNIKHRSPLWFAAKEGHLQIIELLCECGADLNVQDSECEWTPLHAAANGGHQYVVEYLILHGATVSACDKQGRLKQTWRPRRLHVCHPTQKNRHTNKQN